MVCLSGFRRRLWLQDISCSWTDRSRVRGMGTCVCRSVLSAYTVVQMSCVRSSRPVLMRVSCAVLCSLCFLCYYLQFITIILYYCYYYYYYYYFFITILFSVRFCLRMDHFCLQCLCECAMCSQCLCYLQWKGGRNQCRGGRNQHRGDQSQCRGDRYQRRGDRNQCRGELVTHYAIFVHESTSVPRRTCWNSPHCHWYLLVQALSEIEVRLEARRRQFENIVSDFDASEVLADLYHVSLHLHVPCF